MPGEVKVVVDCSAPSKDRELPLLAAAIEDLMTAARAGRISVDTAKTRSEELVLLAVEISEAPDQVQVLPLTAEDRAQRELDAIAAVESAWRQLRADRNGRLTASDWTQLADAGLSAAKVSAWANYRAALRDLPAKTSDPFNPTWPPTPG